MTATGEMLGESKACVTLRVSTRTGTLLHSVKTASTLVMMLLTLPAMASQIFAVSLFSTLPSENGVQMLTPVGFCLALFLLDIFVVASETRTYWTIGFVLYSQFLIQLPDIRESMPGLSGIHRNTKVILYVKQTWVICSDFKTDPRSTGQVDRDFCLLMLCDRSAVRICWLWRTLLQREGVKFREIIGVLDYFWNRGSLILAPK